VIKKYSVSKQQVHFKDLGIIDYKAAWDYQEQLVQENVLIKREMREQSLVNGELAMVNHQSSLVNDDELAIKNSPLTTDNSQLSDFIHHSPLTIHQFTSSPLPVSS